MGGSALAPAYVVSGAAAAAPEEDATTKAGYALAGWYLDEACTQEFTFGQTLNENITLYAKWTPGSVNYMRPSARAAPPIRRQRRPQRPMTASPGIRRQPEPQPAAQLRATASWC